MDSAGNLDVYQQEHEQFDFDSIILRRADPDDVDQINNLVEIGKDDVFNRVYSYPKIDKIIETSYLSITVLDREGRVVAFAAFEDYPQVSQANFELNQGMRGMYDEKHFNAWELWFKKAFDVEEFTPFNTLWLTYFISGGSVAYDDQRFVFKKILQTVYTSVEDIIGVLFLMRGDADEEDSNYCFDPLKDYFEEIPCKHREVLKDVRGIHFNSKVFFSSRVLVLPFIEIRLAKQEDHDDLADVFNSQSETVTEAYGEYFIAELIAAQSDQNKAFVAQVKDKAVGLLGLTSEVDVKLLHQCFDLDSFDNLLKPEFMNAIRARRDYILEERKKEAQETRLQELRRLKEETMKCNIIAQRISLQEFMMDRADEIKEKINELTQNDQELAKENKLDWPTVNSMMLDWLSGFELIQPSDYFLEHPTDDYELMCNTQSELEFLISTLEIFGLPEDYTIGKGHFPNFGKKDPNDKMDALKKKANFAKNKGKKGPNAMMKKLMAEKGMKTGDEVEQRPTHFDLEPFINALQKFLVCNGKIRSEIRQKLKQFSKAVESIFVDEHGEQSFKKCIDIKAFGKFLKEKGIKFEPEIIDNMGALFIAFGEIQFQLREVERMPEETEEEKRTKEIQRLKEIEDKKAAEEGDKKGKKKKKEAPKVEEEKKDDKPKEPPKPIKVLLYETSIHDLLHCLDNMADYDYILFELDIMKADILEELYKTGVRERPKEMPEEDEDEKPSEQDSQPPSAKIGQRSFKMSAPVLPDVKIEQPKGGQYSMDLEYDEIVQDLEDLDSIPEPPDKAKNAFAITLFCMEAAFESRSKDFLKYAFDQFPDRDYLIVTQPHTVAENSLLQKFTLAYKKSENTFSHVLYIVHRDQLYEQDMQVSKATRDDIEAAKGILGEGKDLDIFYEAAVFPDSVNMSYIVRIGDDLIGAFVISKDVNLDYYKSHFHIQDLILLNEHEKKAHSRLIVSQINPIFQRSTRFILKELQRLAAKSCIYFEVNAGTVIPTIFQELIHVRGRRFPHFLNRKWDHERFEQDKITNEEEDKNQMVEGKKRDTLDEEEPPFALCFTTKRILSEPKIVKNSRIVVIGASDTGISFIEALLSISYLHFTNIILIAPGGLPHHHFDEKNENLKSYSTSYTNQELKMLMLETRVRVINSRVVEIDRSEKNVILNDDSVVPYDTLILTMGLQDKTLNCLDYVSRGIAPANSEKKRVEGVLSVDDPYLYLHLRKGGTLMNVLTNRKRPQQCVVYGRTLNTYCCIQGLMQRGMKAEQILLVIPSSASHVEMFYDEDEEMQKDLPIINADAFESEDIEEKVQKMLEEMGIRIVRNAQLIEISDDEDHCLQSVLFKKLDIPDDEEDDDEMEGMEDKSEAEKESRQSGRTNQDLVDHLEGEGAEGDGEEHVVHKKKRKRNELDIECKVLITAGHKDVDQDVFMAIHNNGLVYNGRLIVDKNFQTTDPSIFAAGPLTEFSGRYKALSQGRPLRLDRYNGREMGSRLARSVFDIYDPNLRQGVPDPSALDDELPTFYLPQGQGGILPNNLVYYHIKTTNPLFLAPDQEEKKNRKDLQCDNLDMSAGKGHFIKFTFNNIGLIDSVTYIGHEEIILQSLWSFVGLHENYLNSLTSRFDNGIIPNVAEFLQENWAMALYHEWFGDFCLRMRTSLQGLQDVQQIMSKAFEKTKNGEGVSRGDYDDLHKLLDPKTVKMIEDETLEFIKVNMNHLPMYYIPGEEFQ